MQGDIGKILIVHLWRRVEQFLPEHVPILPARPHLLEFLHDHSIQIARRESCYQRRDLRRHTKHKARDGRYRASPTPSLHKKIACERYHLVRVKRAYARLPRFSARLSGHHPTPPRDALKIEIQEHHGTTRRAV